MDEIKEIEEDFEEDYMYEEKERYEDEDSDCFDFEFNDEAYE